MKTKIIIYSLLFLLIAGIVYLVIARQQTPIGLSTGEIKSYIIVKKDIYEGRPAGLLYNDKGFVFVTRTADRITIVQTDNNGKKIFTIREGLIDMNAVFSNVSLASNPAGSRLCVAWAEKLDKFIKLYYKFYDIESVNQMEAVKIDEASDLSCIDLFYNNEYDEFVIFYATKDIPKLVTIDSLGYNKPSIDLKFKFIPKKMDMIWNRDERLYVVVIHKEANNYRLIQFDSNGNLISDNDFIVENISKPVNISINYYSVNTGYNLLISQENTLYFTAIDNRGYVLDVKKKIIPFNFKGEFDITDNEESYDLVYYGALQKPMKRIFHTSISYEGAYSNKYNKLVDFKGGEETHSPMAVFSKDNINILCTAEGLNTISVLGSSSQVKARDYEAQSKPEESVTYQDTSTPQATVDTASTADNQISATEVPRRTAAIKSQARLKKSVPSDSSTKDTFATLPSEIPEQVESKKTTAPYQYIPEVTPEIPVPVSKGKVTDKGQVKPEEITLEPQVSEENPEPPSHVLEEPGIGEEIVRLEDIMKYQPADESIPEVTPEEVIQKYNLKFPSLKEDTELANLNKILAYSGIPKHTEEVTPEKIMARYDLKPISAKHSDIGYSEQLKLKQILSYTTKDIPKITPVNPALLAQQEDKIKAVPVPEDSHKPSFAEIYKRWLRELINKIVDKLAKLKYRKRSQ